VGLLPLELLSDGQWADVAEVSGEPHWIRRLAELGVAIGSRLRVLQPGSPCIVQVGQARLSLRGEESLQVLVRPIPAVG
jgi:ferrous iron transport protein A